MNSLVWLSMKAPHPVVRKSGISANVPTLMTLPKEQLWHQVTDDQLNLICNSAGGTSSAGWSIAAGACLGSAPGAYSFAAKFIKDAGTMTGLDLVNLLIFSITFVVAIVIFQAHVLERKSTKVLADALRARKKHPVRLESIANATSGTP